MARQAVLVVALGEEAGKALALGRSLKLIGDQTRRIVCTDALDQPWSQCFHTIVPAQGKLDPEAAYRIAEADELLILPANALAFKRLAPIFEYGRGKGVCVREGLVYIEKDGIPPGDHHTIPEHLDFIETATDAFKRVEIDVESNTCRLLAGAPMLRRVEPLLIVCGAHHKREAKKLERLARIEETTKRGFVPFTLRMRRSFDKRILKLMGKV